jgi:hypothetical protein
MAILIIASFLAGIIVGRFWKWVKAERDLTKSGCINIGLQKEFDII